MFYQPRTVALKDLGLLPRKVSAEMNVIEDDAFKAVFDDETLFYDVFFSNDR